MSLIILVALFPLIALIALGYVIKRSMFVEDSFWKGAEKINYYIFFPVMLFTSLAFSEIKLNAIESIFSVISIIFCIALIILYVLKTFYKIHPSKFGVYVQSNLRFNSYIGLAVVYALFHQQGMAVFAILLVLGIPIVNVFSVFSLTHVGQMKPVGIIFSLLKNPLILGSLFGGVFNFSGLQLWGGLAGLLKQLALCSLPLGLMCVGAALNFKGLSSNYASLCLNTFTRLVMMPICAYLFCKILNVPQLETQILVLFFALPTASASYILTKVLGGDSQLMAGIISLQTVIAAFTLPLALIFLF